MTDTFGNPEGLKRQGQALIQAAQGLSAVTDYLSGQVDGLVPANWYGRAADTFTGDWANRIQQAVQLSGVCAHIGQVLVKLASDLDAANQLASRAQNLVPGPVAGRGLDPAGEQKSQQMLGQAQQQAQQAWNTARSRLAGIRVPSIGPRLTVSQVDAWAERLVPLPPPSPPWYESLWHGIEHGAEDVGNFFANNWQQLLAMGLGGGEMLGGGMLALLGAGGEAGGLVLDATGVGAVIGVPANVVSAGAITLGIAGVWAGAKTFELGVTHMNMSADSGGGSGGGSGRGGEPTPPKQTSPKVSDVLKTRKGSILRAPLPKGSPSWSDIQDMTLDEIQAEANANKPGFKTILKLLRDNRFKK